MLRDAAFKINGDDPKHAETCTDQLMMEKVSVVNVAAS